MESSEIWNKLKKMRTVNRITESWRNYRCVFCYKWRIVEISLIDSLMLERIILNLVN